MHTIGTLVVYRQNVCRIVDILPNYRDGRDYYQLEGHFDTSLVIHTPMELADACMRHIMSRDEAESVIDDLPTYEDIEPDGAVIREICAEHMERGNHRNIMRILRAHRLEKSGAVKPVYRWNEGDRQALRVAEEILYRELGAALGKSSKAIRSKIYDRLTAAVARQVAAV
jgi:CarD family transcriptional regulator